MSTRQRIQDRPELVRNTLIYLEDTEIKLYTDIGQARYNNNRKKSVKDTAAKPDKSDPYKFDILGVAGELALYKIIGEYPNGVMDIGIRSMERGTDKGDLLIDGLTVDVKTTDHVNGRLLAVSNKCLGVIDLFALVIKISDDYFILRGFYPCHLLIKEENFNRADGKLVRPCYNVGQEELMDYDEAVKKLQPLKKSA
jgi:hypothetical protein